MTTRNPLPDASLGEQLTQVIDKLPPDTLSLQELLDVFGDEGLLLVTILLTLVFLIPVSIPGVSTVFGAAILLVGISRLIGRPLWLPQRLRRRALPADKLRPGLTGGLVWVRRLEKISRPHRLRLLADGAPVRLVNTLPALALLLYAIGFIQRDGVAVLLGHLANIGTLIYFGVLISGGGLAVRELLQRVGL
jgi:hypothetical protein